MKDLVKQLMQEVNLTEKQAIQSIQIIKEFAKRNYLFFPKRSINCLINTDPNRKLTF